METQVKKSEAEVLFPDIEIEGYKIRPWTWDQLVAVLPDIMSASEEFMKLNIDFGQIEILAADPKRRPELLKSLVPILLALGPTVPKVVAKTIGEDIEKINKWDFTKTLNIALVIAVQNAERIKNSAGLVANQLALIGPRPLVKQ